MAQTMLERYGGLAFVSRVVLEFYDRVLDCDRLAPCFQGLDMRRLVEHQTQFIGSVMGGPHSHTNEELRDIHAHLGIDEETFARMIGLLESTFRSFEIDEADITTIIVDIAARKPFIVTVQNRHSA